MFRYGILLLLLRAIAYNKLVKKKIFLSKS